MNGGWSIYVIALVALNLLGCLVLLWRTSRRDPSDAPAEKTGHVWDGDITEFNKPLPRWWINLFYLTIIFAIGYLALVPGSGQFRRLLGLDVAEGARHRQGGRRCEARGGVQALRRQADR